VTSDTAVYLARKIGGAVVSFAVLLVIGFVIFSLIPANPLETLTRGRAVSAAQLAFLRQELGLNQPVLERFWSFAWNTLHGNLGYSWQFQTPVATLIGQRLWPTLLLTGSAMIVSLIAGLWLGVRSGWRPGSPLDRVATGVSLTFWSVPTFWLGLILLSLLAVGVGPIPALFPAGGMSTPGTPGGLAPSHILDVARHLVLPCLTLSLVIFAQYVTIMRSSVIDELGSPYLLTARAKGLRDAQVRRDHAVPNALLPTVTVIFLQLGGLVTGAITVETVFSWPGLGYLTYQALQIPDLPLLEGTFIVFSASVIVMNTLADIVYRYLDPRVRRQ
jgi:peptide/nickel transport system permease protein